MQPMYLKFNTNEEAEAALIDAGFTRDTESGILYHADMYLDIVGDLFTATGPVSMDEDGKEYPTAVKLDGWHVNMLVDTLPVNLLPYVVMVNSPARVWAGY